MIRNGIKSQICDFTAFRVRTAGVDGEDGASITFQQSGLCSDPTRRTMEAAADIFK